MPDNVTYIGNLGSATGSAKNMPRNPAKKPPDRGEDVALMEPMLVPEAAAERAGLHDLAMELSARSAGFKRSLQPGIHTALADLVRAMNCYYSNLIEGHNTHPVDIEKAMKGDYSKDQKKRNLQLEAKAHINVQRWIDSGGLAGSPATIANIQEVHRRFCGELPGDLLRIEDKDQQIDEIVVPGAFRTHDVAVGKHIPISPGAVPRFMQRFETAYARLGKFATILASAAMHHRFAWIHPFLDGNGRVVRLMSHAVLLQTLDSGGVWSVARGLARNVEAYKSHLAECDLPRRNDLDGRGSLSQEAMVKFTAFFLRTCLDQVGFMERLVQPDRLITRIKMWVEEETRLGELPSHAMRILEAVLYRGEVRRTELADIAGVSTRTGQRTLSALLDKAVLVSDTPKGPVRISFPAALASRWMPDLFPEQMAL